MKRKSLVCCLIILAMCLSVVFAACSSKIDAETLDVVISNIALEQYGITETPSTYTLNTKVSTYDAKGKDAVVYVEWTIEDQPLVKITKDGDTATVNIPTGLSSPITYKLRATLTNAKGTAYSKAYGDKYTVLFERIVPVGGGNQGGGNQGGGNQGGGQGTTPTPGNGTQSNPYTVAQALEIISGLSDNTPTSLYYVKGVVSGAASKGTSGAYKFDIVDSGSTDKLTVYYATLPSTVATAISDGDNVVISGVLTNYSKDGTYHTPEITYTDTISCTVVSLTSSSSSGGNQGGNQGGGTDVPAGAQTLTITMSEYASANNWTVSSSGNEVPYTTVNSTCATITVNAVQNDKSNKILSGAWYTNWRLYSSESATLTFTANSGYTIVSVKITFTGASGETGSFSNNGQTVLSGDSISVNGTSLSLSVASKQARITAIEIVYKAA